MIKGGSGGSTRSGVTALRAQVNGKEGWLSEGNMPYAVAYSLEPVVVVAGGRGQ